MFSTVLQEVKAYFGRSSLLTVFFPLLIFVGASLAVYFEMKQGLLAAMTAWGKASVQTQGLTILGTLVFTALLGYLVLNFWRVISDLFEGYWWGIPLLAPLGARRAAWYEKYWLDLRKYADEHIEELEGQMVNEKLQAFFPPVTQVGKDGKQKGKMQPTLLGNVMRAVQFYPYDRYGIDPAIIWPRLRPLLKTEVTTNLEEKRIPLDFLLLMSVLSAVFTLIWCPVLALSTRRWDLFLLCSLGWPLAWFCYQVALQSAVAYGEQLKATFDLYRDDLLKTLSLPNKSNWADKRREWQRVAKFFYNNLPLAAPPGGAPLVKPWDQVATELATYLKRLNATSAQPQKEIPHEQGVEPPQTSA